VLFPAEDWNRVKLISNLGPLFFAFLGGGVFGVSANVMSATFLGDELPRLWWLLLGSCLTLVLAATMLCFAAIAVAQLEAAQAALPTSLAKEEWERSLDAMVRPARPRVYWTLVSGTALSVAGLIALPVRIMLLDHWY
jgi:hypothetical protein